MRNDYTSFSLLLFILTKIIKDAFNVGYEFSVRICNGLQQFSIELNEYAKCFIVETFTASVTCFVSE